MKTNVISLDQFKNENNNAILSLEAAHSISGGYEPAGDSTYVQSESTSPMTGRDNDCVDRVFNDARDKQFSHIFE